MLDHSSIKMNIASLYITTITSELQTENNIIKGEMPKGNARKLWTDSTVEYC